MNLQDVGSNTWRCPMAHHSELSVPMSDLINCLADTIDLVSPELADHHNRVGRVAHALACQFGLPEEERIDLHFVGNLHDIGALSLTDRIRLLSFETLEPQYEAVLEYKDLGSKESECSSG